MNALTRRALLQSAAALAAGSLIPKSFAMLPRNPAGPRPVRASGVEILNPRGRVPLSFFIDDSTCLVNMGHFGMPQFAEAWPKRKEYQKPWQSWPREIPDAFLREFGEFCAAHDVRGKFSIVPYPACVGWLDRELPGWSRRQLQESLQLVRELMLPRWDIHPEMISHTRVIDLKTGRPLAGISDATMENSYPQTKKSVDELAAYLAYALQILKNCDIPCEGITTPGGFGGKVQAELPLATAQAVREVFGAEIPHYFKYVAEGAESTRPVVEYVEGLETANPRVVVNVPAGTGDWFGGWEGDVVPQGDRYANHDATAGRLVELIERGEPAVMLCHWPGLYSNGTKEGFKSFQQVIAALESRYRDRTLWMKISELARYAAVRELTKIEVGNDRAGIGAATKTGAGAPVTLTAPFACPAFTVKLAQPEGAAATSPPVGPLKLVHQGQVAVLEEVRTLCDLKPGTWLRDKESDVVCFDLPKGKSTLEPARFQAAHKSSGEEFGSSAFRRYLSPCGNIQ